MANYRQIHVNIWKDTWFLDLEPREKLLFIYLFSNESTSLSGMYRIARKVISFETGLPDEFIDKALAKFEQADKVHCQGDIVWVKNLRRYNSGSSKVEKRIQSDVQEIPDCELKRRYIAYYSPDIPYLYGMDTLSTEMKLNGMKGNEEEGISTSTPFTPDPYQRIYTNVTGQMAIPSGHIEKALQMLEAIYHNQDRDVEKSVEYLKPFYENWCSRKSANGRPYSRLNIGWLDWAVAGEIPAAKTNPEKSGAAALEDLGFSYGGR